MEKHSNEVKNIHQESPKSHRHILCLYGDDEKLLRLAAMQLGITVSHLIRMALYWFLPKIENMRVNWNEIYYYGTKICRYIDFNRRNRFKMPFLENLFYAKWPIDQWWKKAWPILSLPYTPDREIDEIYVRNQPPDPEQSLGAQLKDFFENP